jgi:hypothetical protein
MLVTLVLSRTQMTYSRKGALPNRFNFTVVGMYSKQRYFIALEIESQSIINGRAVHQTEGTVIDSNSQ